MPLQNEIQKFIPNGETGFISVSFVALSTAAGPSNNWDLTDTQNLIDQLLGSGECTVSDNLDGTFNLTFSGTTYANTRLPQVISVDFAGDGLASIVGVQKGSLPFKPTYFAYDFDTITETTVDFSWSDLNDNETGFLIEKSLAGANSWSSAATAAANATSVTASGLAAGTTYDFRLYAVNAAGNSQPYLLEGISTLTPEPAAPSAPTHAPVASGLTIVEDITPDAGDDPVADEFWVRLTSGETGTLVNTTGLLIYEAASGGEWIDSAGNGSNLTGSSFSEGRIGYQLDPGSNISAAAVPVNISQPYTLAFWKNASGGLGVDDALANLALVRVNASLTINVRAPAAPDDNKLRLFVGSSIDESAVANATWNYVVVTFDGTTVKVYLNAILLGSQVGMDAGGSAAFQIDNDTNGPYAGGMEQLTFDTSAWPVAKIAHFYRSGLGLPYADRNTVYVGGSTTPTITNDANGVALIAGTYELEAACKNDVGRGAWSAAEEVVLIAPPTAPSALTAGTITTTSIGLSWTDNSSDEDNFLLEKSLHGANTWSTVSSPAANATTATASGLTASTAYDFRIKAVNGGGSSSYATLSNVSTEAAATAKQTQPFYGYAYGY